MISLREFLSDEWQGTKESIKPVVGNIIENTLEISRPVSKILLSDLIEAAIVVNQEIFKWILLPGFFLASRLENKRHGNH